MKTIKLEKLVGLHTLSGVETGYIKDRPYEWSDLQDCNYISFILDGKKYTAVEDPSDGYRSSLSYLQVGRGKIKNTFPDTQVFVIMGHNVGYANELAKFYETETAKLVLAVGTDNADDYYPFFVGHFYPENLPVNKGKKL